MLPGDALLGFALPAHDGGRSDPETALRVTLATLGADFTQGVTTNQVAGLLQAFCTPSAAATRLDNAITTNSKIERAA